jgi:SAM-dependent methyltransferase
MTPSNHWSHYHEKWSRLEPPLRPHPDCVLRAVALLSERDGPVLVLGVTPELTGAFPEVTAVDKSEGMIRGLWSGDGEGRRAVCANWLSLPFGEGEYGAAVGDGSLNALVHPDGYRDLYSELARVLRPRSRVVFRVFRRPDPCESLDAVLDAARAGRIETFHAFKWRFAMALAAASRSASIAVRSIRDRFCEHVPDRDALASSTGWSREIVDTIDVYAGSSEIYSFPSAEELLLSAPPPFERAHFVEVGSYPLADRCPLFVMNRG